MVDPKATSGKAQEILKSMNSKYDNDGNMTIEYFEELEKDFLNQLESYLKRKKPVETPAGPETPAQPAPPAPPTPAPQADAQKKPEVAPVQAPQVQQAPSVDATHQAKQVATQSPVQSIPRETGKMHALKKLKSLMESGATNEEGVLEVTPEQAAFTLNTIFPMFNDVKDDDVEMLKLVEVIGEVAKSKATDESTGVVNPLYSGRAIQIVKQSIAKNIRATEPVRKQILDRYNTMIPFTAAEKTADPIIEAMNRDFKEVFSAPVGDDIRLKLLGPEVGKRYIKYLDNDLMELDNKQLMARAGAEPGAQIKRKQADGRFKTFQLGPEEIEKAKHEMRVRNEIQKINDFLWNNFGITTYLGASMYGSGSKPLQKREKVMRNLSVAMKELNEELNRSEVEMGKSSIFIFDSTEFPEEERIINDKTILTVKR